MGFLQLAAAVCVLCALLMYLLEHQEHLTAYVRYLTRLLVWGVSTLVCRPPRGHGHSLAGHETSFLHVQVLDDPPSAATFLQDHVHEGRPVLLRGLAHLQPAFSLWNDSYLRQHYGSLMVNVEPVKKEVRTAPSLYLPLSQFLHNYTVSGQYVVDSVHEEMYGDLLVPGVINCDAVISEVMTDVVMWFSAGSTSSVLHSDAVNNIICQLDGSKHFLMADKAQLHEAELDQSDGLYSSVNVDNVDLLWYQALTQVRWYSVLVTAGDCLFIPAMWPHQVSSSRTRNLAVSTWFLQPHSHCCNVAGSRSLQHVHLADAGLIAQSELIRMADRRGTLTDIMFEDIYGSLMHEHQWHVVFQQLDLNADQLVTADEMWQHDNARFLRLFPNFQPAHTLY